MRCSSDSETVKEQGRDASLTAEAPVRTQLEQLDAGGWDLVRGAAEASGQERADTLLSQIAWARLAEPGDSAAVTLITTLGAKQALAAVLHRHTSAQQRSLAASSGLSLQQLREAMRRWEPRLDRSATLRDIEQANEAGLRAVIPGDPCWPEPLGDLGAHQPIMLWVKGDVAQLRSHSLSVVGARAATGYGTHVTAEIVNEVCISGVTIVSGAAYGIDAVAHRTALAAETPTIAVLAGGADRAYPQAHESLLERISQTGAVCSEMIPGAAPTRWRFLQRNRIIASLSVGTLVTEAGARSGSINTAGHAASVGRALGAVPGPVTSAASAGCHRLLREYGASLVSNGREALELLGLARDGSGEGSTQRASDGAPTEAPRQSSVHQRVLDALPLRGGKSSEDIVRRAGLSSVEVRAALAELELLGSVQRNDSSERTEERWRLLRRE